MTDSEETTSFEFGLATTDFEVGADTPLTAKRGGEGGTFRGRVEVVTPLFDPIEGTGTGPAGHDASTSTESRGKVELE